MLFRLARRCALIGIAATNALSAQSMGSSGSVVGVVTDPSGGTVANAAVSMENPVSHYQNQVKTDSSGSFRFTNIPFSHYRLTVEASGFQTASKETDVRTSIPITLNIKVELSASTSSVTVTADGGVLVESVPTAHTDVDEKQFSQLPITSTATGLSDVITMSAPGVVADSNGMFHPLGDHGQTSYMVDNQPISDQQSKQFSTQLPENAVLLCEERKGYEHLMIMFYADRTCYALPWRNLDTMAAKIVEADGIPYVITRRRMPLEIVHQNRDGGLVVYRWEAKQ